MPMPVMMMTMMEGSLPTRLFFLFLLVGISSCTAPPPLPPSSASSSPWMDTSLCPLTDSLMVCQLKKGMCSPINTVFSPPGGPVKAVTTCANSTGAVLGPQFFMSAGLSFLAGSPESLADKASSDPTTAAAIRRCALNTSGLLNADLLSLNRTVVANSLSSAFITPELGEAVASAADTCPEPVNYKVTDFMNCLRIVCMSNVAVTPFINMATSALTGAAASGAALPAAAPKKPVAPKTTGSSVPPSSGSSAYSAGGAFAYPGAGAGGASGAAGTSAYMAGAFPYAGAGGATGGAVPASGASAYMAGAFPYAGAGAGGGAFPYSSGAASAAKPVSSK